MLFASIWLVGLSGLSLGCVYYFLTHDSSSHGEAKRLLTGRAVRSARRRP